VVEHGNEELLQPCSLHRHGFTMLSSAWQWDITPEGPDDVRLVFTPPGVQQGENIVTGWVSNEFTVATASEAASFLGINGKSYPRSQRDDARAVLTVRQYPDSKRTVVPRDAWTFMPPRRAQRPLTSACPGASSPG
jgi:hypothetical protein